ncbi:MAG: acyl-CoA dehydrogenase family protein, partial [Pseudomonadota bacterium]
QQELDAFRVKVRDWLAENKPGDPGFVMPQNGLTITTQQQFDFLRAWQRQLYDAGFVGVEWQVQYGGQGLAPGHQDVISQELLRSGAPFLLNIVGLGWAGPIILSRGTEAQKQRFLQKILSAEEVWCQGFSEPNSGSDLASLQTRAQRDGDDYVINGQKVWTSQGAYAEYMILLARTDPTVPKHAGISYFLLPMHTRGVEVKPIFKITGEGGFNQVFFTDVRIPADALLGEEGQGWSMAVETLSFERGVSEGSGGGDNTGGRQGVQAVMDLVLSLKRDGKPLIDDPVVRDKLAAFDIEATALQYNAQRAKIPGLVSGRPMSLPLTRKITTTEHEQRLADYICELQGYMGSLWKGDPAALEAGEWQRRYFNSYSGTIAGGTSEILRNVVGEKVLNLPKTR